MGINKLGVVCVRRCFSYGETETEYLKRKDKKLGIVIERIGHIERETDTDVFSALVHHIVGQQISTKAQQTIWQRLLDKLGTVTPDTVRDADATTLQTLGISSRKISYIKDLVAQIDSGAFSPTAVAALSDAEAIHALTKLKGVGVWTAEMILLFSLERPDILSYDDLAIQRGMRMVYRHRQITRALFAKYKRRLSPYGSVASLYFWAVSGGAVPELTDPQK